MRRIRKRYTCFQHLFECLIIFIALSSVSKRSLSLSSLNSNMTNDLLFLFEAHQKVCSIISRNVVSFLKSASTVMVPGATLTHLSVVIHNDICHMCCVSLFVKIFTNHHGFILVPKICKRKYELLNFNIIKYFFVNFFESTNILFEVGLIFKFTTVLKRYI